MSILDTFTGMSLREKETMYLTLLAARARDATIDDVLRQDKDIGRHDWWKPRKSDQGRTT